MFGAFVVVLFPMAIILQDSPANFVNLGSYPVAIWLFIQSIDEFVQLGCGSQRELGMAGFVLAQRLEVAVPSFLC